MKYSHDRAFVGIAVIVVIAVTAAVSTMTFLGEKSVNADSQEGEPLTAELFDLYSGGSKDYIAQTGRMVTDEYGRVEIKFDRPEVPSVEQSIKMTADAVEANDSSLLPYCSAEYFEYLASTKDSRESAPVAGNMAACIAIPSRIGFSRSGSPD